MNALAQNTCGKCIHHSYLHQPNSQAYDFRIWLAGFGSILLYVPLFLFSRGNLVCREDRDDKTRWEWHFPALQFQTSYSQNGSAPHDEELEEDLVEQQALRSQAWRMLM